MRIQTNFFQSGIFILLMAASLVFLPGCMAKRYAKKASKFEEAGLYKDAAEFYYKSVERNRSKVEPKLGLRKNGQLVLNDMLVDFETDYKRDETESAVYSYRKANDYYNKLKFVGVDLSFPEKFNGFYNDVKNSFLTQKYIEGLEKNNREEYAKAETIFKEIVEISPDYKDAQKQLEIAIYEPIYQEANKLYYSGKPRSAYWLFYKITNEASNFKDAQSLKDRAREDATISILITPIEVSGKGYSFNRITAKENISQAINKLNNPFLRIIDKSAIDESILKKDNGNYNMKALNLAGISTILKVEVTDVKEITGKTKVETKPAYIKIERSTKSENGQVKKVVDYKKTTYKSYSQTNYAALELTYRFLDTGNGSVILSGTYSERKEDNLRYGRYNGDINDLVPGTWKDADKDSPEDRVGDKPGEVTRLRKLLRASDQVATSKHLLDEATKAAVDKIALRINTYNPEK